MNKPPLNRFTVNPLSADDGGGWLVTFPDLPGCVSDGDSIEEAVANAAEAENAYLSASKQWSANEKSGKLTLRLPISIHKQLKIYAKREKVSLNTLIVSYLSAAIK